MVYDSNPTARGYGLLPRNLHVMGDYLYFFGDDDVHGYELWRSDGTWNGTQMIVDIVPGAGTVSLSNLTDAGGKLFFTASDIAHGRELWTYDPKSNAANMVLDITSGSGSSFPAEMVAFNNHLWFMANGSSNSPGQPGLWMSDGTPAGTIRMHDVKDPLSRRPPMAGFNGEMFFMGYETQTGIELYKITPPTPRPGGPYQVEAGQTITLDASQSSSALANGALTYAWDLDGDGSFGETGSAAARGDEIGARPTLSTIDLPPGTCRVWLQVTDADGVPAVQSVDVSVSIPHFFSLSPDALITWEGAGSVQWITLSRGSLSLNGAVHNVYPQAALWVENNASVSV